MRTWRAVTWLVKWSNGGRLCEHGYGPSGSIKREFLCYLFITFQRMTTKAAPISSRIQSERGHCLDTVILSSDFRKL